MTVEDKCIKLVGDTMLKRKVHGIMVKRNQDVMDFLTTKKNLPPGRIKVILNKDSLKTQDISQPEFEINYKADETAEDK